MQEFLHNWVYGVACAGGFCALCFYLCPAGRVKQVLQMACACVMLLAMFAPLRKLNPAAYGKHLARYRTEAAALETESDALAERLNRLVIEQEYREYILDKAAEIGQPLTDVTVRVQWDSEGFWVPQAVYYSAPEGNVTPAFRELMETELGISKERQIADETNE